MRPTPFEDPIPLCERCVHHEGVLGFSVQCAGEVPLDRLVGWYRNKKVGVATVGEIRVLRYDVLVTTGKGHHATVVVPIDWDHASSQGLVRLGDRQEFSYSRCGRAHTNPTRQRGDRLGILPRRLGPLPLTRASGWCGWSPRCRSSWVSFDPLVALFREEVNPMPRQSS